MSDMMGEPNKNLPHQEPIEWQTAPELWAKLKPIARQKRREPSEAETRLWTCLSNRQMLGLEFRRQQAIGRFIVDFYCTEAHLIVEVDGPNHQYTPVEEAVRREYLESLKLRVLRFTSAEILSNMEAVNKRIEAALRVRLD